MQLSFQRKVDRYLGAFICRVLSWRSRLRQPVRALPSNPGIVVILLSEMGSLILSQPLFCQLKSMWPEARIYALVFERNREALELLDVIPPQNILTISDRTFLNFAKDGFRAAINLRRLGIAVAIDAELFSRISSIFSYLSGADFRVGFHPHTQEGLYRGDFINRPVLYNPYQHFSIQLLSLAQAISSTTTPKNKAATAKLPPVPPQVPVTDKELETMRARLTADFPALEQRRLVLINPGGGMLPIRAWPSAHYQKTSRKLVECGFAVGIIGMETDRPLAAQITGNCQHPACTDLTGYTRTLRELIQLFHLSDLLITNDGGPGHLAALTPIAAIVLFGPETPRLYQPLGKKTVVLDEQVACAPCLTAYNHRSSPCDGDNICMQRISPDRVLEAALAMLDRPSAGRP